MKKIFLLIFMLSVISCSHTSRKPDPRAVKLNDSAMAQISKSSKLFDSVELTATISLLNKAIQIDSNYQTAYFNKFEFQIQLKQYAEAVETGKHLIKLNPDNIEYQFTVGMSHDIMKDTLSANQYYRSALSIANKHLNTINTTSKNYKSLQIEKAILLTMLSQPENAHAILDDLEQKSTDNNFKEWCRELKSKTKDEFLHGK